MTLSTLEFNAGTGHSMRGGETNSIAPRWFTRARSSTHPPRHTDTPAATSLRESPPFSPGWGRFPQHFFGWNSCRVGRYFRRLLGRKIRLRRRVSTAPPPSAFLLIHSFFFLPAAASELRISHMAQNIAGLL